MLLHHESIYLCGVHLSNCLSLPLLQKEETRFNESRARFYIGEIILALEYLHGFGIVFRSVPLRPNTDYLFL